MEVFDPIFIKLSEVYWDPFIVLAAVILVLAAFISHGRRKGFLRMLFSLASVVIAIMIGSCVTPNVAAFISEKTGFTNTVKENVASAFEEYNSVRDNSVYESQVETINSYSVPETLKSMLISNDTPEIYEKLLVSYFEDYVATYLSGLIVQILTFVVTILLIMIILKVTVLSLDFISNLPVLHFFNKLLGAFAGGAEGIFAVWLIFLILTTFVGGSLGQRFSNAVNENYILTMIYEVNPLLVFVKV